MQGHTVGNMRFSFISRICQRWRQPRRAFTMIEIVVSFVVVSTLSVVSYAGFKAIVSNDQDASAEAELSLVARQANGDWVSTRKWSEAVSSASSDAGFKALLDSPTTPAPSLKVGDISYRAVDTRVGMATRTKRGFCAMGLISNRAVKVWTVESDLGSSCAGRLALIGPAAPTVYTATPATLATPSAITAVGSRGQVLVTWTSTASSHELYRDGVLVGAASSPYVDKNVKGGMTYAYTVRSVSPTGAYSPLVGPAAGLTAPSAPTDLAARYTSGSVTATWALSAGTVAGYRLFNNAGVQVWQGTALTASYAIATAPEYVTVRAYNASGESLDSDKAYIDAELSAPRTLAAITVGDRSAKVGWVAPLNGKPSGYMVYLDGAKVLTVTELSAALSSLKNGTTYKVTVKAFDASQVSAASNEISITPGATAPASPTVPSAAFCADGSASSMRVTWVLPEDDPDNPLQGFRVFVNGSTSASVEVRAPLTSAVVTGLTPGQTYSFTVQAWRTGGVSAVSAAVSKMAGCLPTAPLNPRITVNPPSSATGAFTAAPAAQPAIDYYEYGCVSYRPTPSSTLGTNVTATAMGATATSISVSGLTVGSRYGCYARSHSPLGYSETAPCAVPTNQLDPTTAPTNPNPGCYFITILAPTAPAAPTLAKGDGSMPVSWAAVTSTEVRPVDGYRVYLTANRPTKCFSTDATPCLKETSNTTASCTTTALSCTITGLTNGTSYTVYVQTYNTAFSNDGGNTTRTIIGPPPTPATPTISNNTTTCLRVTGSATSTTANPVSGYVVYRSGTNIATVSSFTDDCSRTPGTQYCYTVVSYNADWTSAASPSGCGYTRQNPPTLTVNMAVLALDASWTAVTGAERYEYYLPESVSYTGWTSNAATTSINRTGLVECKWYTFYVRAYSSTWGYTDAAAVAQRTLCVDNAYSYEVYSTQTVTRNAVDVWRYDHCTTWNGSTYTAVASCTKGWRGWAAEDGGGSTFAGTSGIFGWDRFYSPTIRRYHYAVGFNFNDYNVGGTATYGGVSTAVSAANTTIRNCRVRLWPTGADAINNGDAYAWEFQGGTAEMHLAYHNDWDNASSSKTAFGSDGTPPSRNSRRIVELSTVQTSTASDDDGSSSAIVTLPGSPGATGVDDCSAWKNKTAAGLLVGPVLPASVTDNAAVPKQEWTYAGTSNGGSSVSRAGWLALSSANNGTNYLFSPRLKFERWWNRPYVSYY